MIFFKEIKDLNEWKDMACSWTRRFKIVKAAVLPTWFYTARQCGMP
jgi:hypothetical protein